MHYNWEKRWNFCEKYYCEDFIISKMPAPQDGWHLEKVLSNGESKHYGTYNKFESAQHVAEDELKSKRR